MQDCIVKQNLFNVVCWCRR